MKKRNKNILFSFSLGAFAILIVRSAFISNEPENITEDDTPVTDNRQANLNAFLKTIQYAEGTFNQNNPYAVTYAYRHTINNFSDHPTITGEWSGEILPDRFCTGAGLSPGCRSTAAGAYQIIVPTWKDIKRSLPSLTFLAHDQDNAAVFLIERRGALFDIEQGHFRTAINKLNREWASLPNSPYGQPTRSMAQLENFYATQGGTFAQA